MRLAILFTCPGELVSPNTSPVSYDEMFPTGPSLLPKRQGMLQYNKHHIHTASFIIRNLLSAFLQKPPSLYRPHISAQFVLVQQFSRLFPLHFVNNLSNRSFSFLYLCCSWCCQGIFLVSSLSLCCSWCCCQDIFPVSYSETQNLHFYHTQQHWTKIHNLHTFSICSSNSGKSNHITESTSSSIFCSKTSSLKLFKASAHSILDFVSKIDKVLYVTTIFQWCNILLNNTGTLFISQILMPFLFLLYQLHIHLFHLLPAVLFQYLFQFPFSICHAFMLRLDTFSWAIIKRIRDVTQPVLSGTNYLSKYV